MIYRLIIFLVLNFAALAIGGLFTSNGVTSEWYINSAKAPWTPPGWVFGAAWTTIMICFTIYMSYLWLSFENKKLLIVLFAVQWILNIAWNPIFFHYHNAAAGLVVIAGLTALVGFFLVNYWPELKVKSILILPYLIWLLIATSLNGYIVLKN
ncbi:MAG: benzodiazapine receptor [Litorivivens sp.]|jgi:benzodiazapine receptor